MTSIIFFCSLGLVALWVLSDYFPAVASLLASLRNGVKSGADKAQSVVENATKPAELSDGDKLVELTKGYVNLRKQLKDAGNDVGLKALDNVFPTLNRDVVNSKN